jgi:hypothetical protein
MYEDECRRYYDPALYSPEALMEWMKRNPVTVSGLTAMCRAPAPGSEMERETRTLRENGWGRIIDTSTAASSATASVSSATSGDVELKAEDEAGAIVSTKYSCGVRGEMTSDVLAAGVYADFPFLSRFYWMWSSRNHLHSRVYQYRSNLEAIEGFRDFDLALDESNQPLFVVDVDAEAAAAAGSAKPKKIKKKLTEVETERAKQLVCEKVMQIEGLVDLFGGVHFITNNAEVFLQEQRMTAASTAGNSAAPVTAR